MIDSTQVMYLARAVNPPTQEELLMRVHMIPATEPDRQIQVLIDAGFRVIGYMALTDDNGRIMTDGGGMLFDLSGNPTGEGLKANDITLQGPKVSMLMPKARVSFRDPLSRIEYDRKIAAGLLDPAAEAETLSINTEIGGKPLPGSSLLIPKERGKREASTL